MLYQKFGAKVLILVLSISINTRVEYSVHPFIHLFSVTYPHSGNIGNSPKRDSHTSLVPVSSQALLDLEAFHWQLKDAVTSLYFFGVFLHYPGHLWGVHPGDIQNRWLFSFERAGTLLQAPYPVPKATSVTFGRKLTTAACIDKRKRTGKSVVRPETGRLEVKFPTDHTKNCWSSTHCLHVWHSWVQGWDWRKRGHSTTLFLPTNVPDGYNVEEKVSFFKMGLGLSFQSRATPFFFTTSGLHHYQSMSRLHNCRRRSDPPVCLTLHHSRIRLRHNQRPQPEAVALLWPREGNPHLSYSEPWYLLYLYS